MRNEHIEGHEWGTYVALVRSTVTEHGMAYRARARRSRSANSTRGGHVPPGHTGEPCTGGSGTGGWMTWRCEVREMRSAAAARAIVRGDSEKATGELIDTETVTSSSEEGRWKRAARYLAGGLSYRMHGLDRGKGREALPIGTGERQRSVPPMRNGLLWVGVSCILCVGTTTVTHNHLPLNPARIGTDARYYAAAAARVLADPSRRGTPVESLAGDGPVEAL
jgi:hypothetical protein